MFFSEAEVDKDNNTQKMRVVGVRQPEEKEMMITVIMNCLRP